MNEKRPVALIVMDGIGIGENDCGNAVKAAYTPNLDRLMESCPHVLLRAHGAAVGLPSDDDMGNSEVGHNALGCGQIYAQGAKLVTASIESGAIFESDAWRLIKDRCAGAGGVLHLLGLLSDGNVHSHINHLKALLRRAERDGIARCRIHILLDGRDVPPESALLYVDDLESLLAGLNCGAFDARIASGGGRMRVTMDRYEADWSVVQAGWETHVLGNGRQFNSASEAIGALRAETGASGDQFLPPFVIAENGAPVGAVRDGDAFVLFNFRGDRALEISRAFDEESFDKFDRARVPDVLYAGILQYDGDLMIPKRYLVSPPRIQNTLSEALVRAGVKQYAVSETQKYGHVTYFWNGNRNEKFSEELEVFEEITSDRVPFEQRPWMQAAQVTDKLISAIQSGGYGFIRCNYPNGDMVGHTGDFQAARMAVEAVDLCLGRVLPVIDAAGAILLVTADHGNADEMYEKATPGGRATPKTAHTLNPVPFIIFDPLKGRKLKQGAFGLSNVAATIAELLGVEKPGMWDEGLLD
jgi:2,3-bisphosphoglycerate-independent phosphoglycerate mutase